MEESFYNPLPHWRGSRRKQLQSYLVQVSAPSRAERHDENALGQAQAQRCYSTFVRRCRSVGQTIAQHAHLVLAR